MFFGKRIFKIFFWNFSIPFFSTVYLLIQNRPQFRFGGLRTEKVVGIKSDKWGWYESISKHNSRDATTQIFMNNMFKTLLWYLEHASYLDQLHFTVFQNHFVYFFLEVFGRSSLFWTPLYIGRLRYSYGLYEFGKPLMHVCFGCLQGRITLSKPLFSISTYFFHQKIVFYLSIFSFKISTDYQIIRQVWNSYKCLLKVKSNHTMYEYTNLILGGWVWRLVSTSQKKKRSMRAFGQISDNIFCIALLFYY